MKLQMHKPHLGMWIRNNLALQFGITLILLVPADMLAQTYEVLHNFTGIDGSHPVAGFVLSGATLYGTTYGEYQGGTSNLGTVFKINTDGTGFVVLKYFAGKDGANPHAGVVLSDSTLYGVTENGGSFDRGTVFRINTDGSGFAVLRNFSSGTWNGVNDGNYPEGRPVVSALGLARGTQTYTANTFTGRR